MTLSLLDTLIVLVTYLLTYLLTASEVFWPPIYVKMLVTVCFVTIHVVSGITGNQLQI